MKKTSPCEELRGRVAIMSKELAEAIHREEALILDHDDFMGASRELHFRFRGPFQQPFFEDQEPYPDGSCASPRCFERTFRSGFCRRHVEIKVLGFRRWFYQNKDAENFKRCSLIRRRNRIRLGLCPDCGRDAVPGQQRCPEHREAMVDSGRRCRARQRQNERSSS